MPRGDRDKWGGTRPSRGRTGRKPKSAKLKAHDRLRIQYVSVDGSCVQANGVVHITRAVNGTRTIEIQHDDGSAIRLMADAEIETMEGNDEGK